MSNEFMLYLMTRADSLQNFAQAGGFFTIAAAGVCTFFYFMMKSIEEQEIPSLLSYAKTLLAIGVTSFFISVAIPTKSDLIFIYGGSTILEAAKSQRANNLGNKTLDVVEKWLEDAASEKKP